MLPCSHRFTTAAMRCDNARECHQEKPSSSLYAHLWATHFTLSIYFPCQEVGQRPYLVSQGARPVPLERHSLKCEGQREVRTWA